MQRDLTDENKQSVAMIDSTMHLKLFECSKAGYVWTTVLVVNCLSGLVKNCLDISKARDCFLESVASHLGASSWGWRRGSMKSKFDCVHPRYADSNDHLLGECCHIEHGEMEHLTLWDAVCTMLCSEKRDVAFKFSREDKRKSWCQVIGSKCPVGLLVIAVPLQHDKVSIVWFRGDFAIQADSDQWFDSTKWLIAKMKWIHVDGEDELSDNDWSERMPNRMRQVCYLLSKGRSRKEVASDIGVSINTVHGYVKELYRCLSVNSHSELLILLYSNASFKKFIDKTKVEFK